jgi:hypothetical protein
VANCLLLSATIGSAVRLLSMVADALSKFVFAAAVVCDDLVAIEPTPTPTNAPTSVKATSIFLVTNMSKISFVQTFC